MTLYNKPAIVQCNGYIYYINMCLSNDQRNEMLLVFYQHKTLQSKNPYLITSASYNVNMFIPVFTLSPICSSDIITDSLFSTSTFAIAGKHFLFGLPRRHTLWHRTIIMWITQQKVKGW